MDIVLILFFISLAVIAFMLGRKILALKKAGVVLEEREVLFITPDFENVKYIALRKMKQYGYILILITLRLSVRTTNLLKQQWTELVAKTQEKLSKKNKHGEELEISRFLKTVSDYKKKINKIKNQIKEEEGLM